MPMFEPSFISSKRRFSGGWHPQRELVPRHLRVTGLHNAPADTSLFSIATAFERSDSCAADDMPIQSQNQPIENKEDKGLNSAKCGQVRKNPQTIRKQN